MKIIPLILAFIIVSQVAVPCCASSTCHESADIELPADSDHNDSKHYCSSLCCGVNFTLSQEELILAEAPLAEAHYLFSYHFDYSFNFLEAVWHPPKS